MRQPTAPPNDPRIVLVYFDSDNPDLLRMDPPAYYSADGTRLGEPVVGPYDELVIEVLVKEFKYLLEKSGRAVTHESFLDELQRHAELDAAMLRFNLQLRIKPREDTQAQIQH